MVAEGEAEEAEGITINNGTAVGQDLALIMECLTTVCHLTFAKVRLLLNCDAIIININFCRIYI